MKESVIFASALTLSILIVIFGIIVILSRVFYPSNPCTLCPEPLPVVRIVDGREITFRCPDAAIALDEKCVVKEPK